MTTRISALASTALLLLPAAAFAHGIGEDARGRSTLEFIPLGIEHMALGWDHLLFIGGVVLFAGELRRAAKLISVFALGHSITLLVATVAGLKLSATFVDAVIALSVVYVGYLGLRTRGEGAAPDWRRVGAIVFGFGLIHGLGLSTRLQDLGLSDDGLVGKVLAFNVGVELGQLFAVAAMVGVGVLFTRRFVPRPERAMAQRIASGTLVPLGLLAGFVAAAPSGAEGERPGVATRTAATQSAGTSPGPAGADGTCEVREHDPAVFAGGAHPGSNFFEPGAAYKEVDLSHVITDGYVVVRYQPSLPAAERAVLRETIAAADGVLFAVPDATAAGAIDVVASRRTLTCTAVDGAAVAAFVAAWVDDVKSGRQSAQ